MKNIGHLLHYTKRKELTRQVGLKQLFFFMLRSADSFIDVFLRWIFHFQFISLRSLRLCGETTTHSGKPGSNNSFFLSKFSHDSYRQLF